MCSSEFKIIAPNSYWIIVPRFVSSLMMHLNVEPDVRNGIQLMKYVVNHPQNFRFSQTDDGKLIPTALVIPFFLGFAQTVIAGIIEVLVVVYLTSLSDLLAIIMKFVTLAAIVKFDDMYAAALFENKIKKLVGAKLNITFKRWMSFETTKEKNDDDLEDEIQDGK